MFALEDFQGKSSGMGVLFGKTHPGTGSGKCSKHLLEILRNLRTALHDLVIIEYLSTTTIIYHTLNAGKVGGYVILSTLVHIPTITL